MRLKEFFLEEDGMGTAEVVIIAAVLVAIALIFRSKITTFVNTVMDNNLDGEGIKIVDTTGGLLWRKN